MIRKYIGNSFKRGCIQLVRRPMYFLLIIISRKYMGLRTSWMHPRLKDCPMYLIIILLLVFSF